MRDNSLIDHKLHASISAEQHEITAADDVWVQDLLEFECFSLKLRSRYLEIDAWHRAVTRVTSCSRSSID